MVAFRLSSFNIAAEDWRQLYEFAEKAHREKAAELGERLRAMTQAEQKSRQTRHVEVRNCGLNLLYQHMWACLAASVHPYQVKPYYTSKFASRALHMRC